MDNIRLAKFNEHIKNQRLDFLHKQSTKITNLYDVVVVENLDLKRYQVLNQNTTLVKQPLIMDMVYLYQC